VWYQLDFGARNTHTEEAEMTEKALFAPLALCDKNLSLCTYGLWETDNFMLT